MRSAPRRRGTRVGLALLAAIAACTGGSSPGPPTTSALGPLPEVPSAHASRHVPGGVPKAIADRLHVKVGKVHVLAGATSGDDALVAFEVIRHGTAGRAFASFAFEGPKGKHERKRWVVDDVAGSLWGNVPAPGSRTYPLASVSAGRWIGIGGFIDPRADRVEAMGPTGAIVDSEPVSTGAVAVFAVENATIAGYDAEGLLFATPVLVGGTGQLSGDQAAVGIGDVFATRIISSQWASAADLVQEDVPPAYLLPPLHLFLASPEARVIGRGQATKTGGTYAIASGSRRWKLTLFVVGQRGTWKVRQYTLSRERP